MSADPASGTSSMLMKWVNSDEAVLLQAIYAVIILFQALSSQAVILLLSAPAVHYPQSKECCTSLWLHLLFGLYSVTFYAHRGRFYTQWCGNECLNMIDLQSSGLRLLLMYTRKCERTFSIGILLRAYARDAPLILHILICVCGVLQRRTYFLSSLFSNYFVLLWNICLFGLWSA